MKRVGYLIEKIADPDNLRLAFIKAKRGKAEKKTVIDFGQNFQEELNDIRNQVLSANVKVGNYHFFTIKDPKERLICAADFRERVLHHAIMNICHPYFEKKQIFDSYASRLNKGTYAAIERAQYFCRKYQWFLKLDVRKYFDQLDHDILLCQLQKMFKDEKLLKVFEQIIGSYNSVKTRKGVPIGNLSSQYFANHYLSLSDHFILEKTDCKAYVRYMDDMVLWHFDKSRLIEVARIFKTFIKENLRLELKPDILHHCSKGLPFLGYLLFPDRIKLMQKSKIRFMKKSKMYEKKLNSGKWSQEQYQAHLNPLLAFIMKADTFSFRKKYFEENG